MRKWIALLLLVSILPVSAQDASDQIELGARLKLGMPQQQALSEVGQHFRTKAMQDPTRFVVYTIPANGEKPVWQGILIFKDAKLASVERLWAYDNDERSVAMTKSLLGVFSSVVKSGRNTCKIEDDVSDTPDASGESVTLNCGKRSIKISVAKVGNYEEDMSVSELLEQ